MITDLLVHIAITMPSSQWLNAGAILAGFLVLALIVRLISHHLFVKVLKRERTAVDNIILISIKSLVFWALLLIGSYFALLEVVSRSGNTAILPATAKLFTIAWVILATVTAVRILSLLSKWRIEQARTLGTEQLRDTATQVGFYRKLITAVIAIVSFVYILVVIGVNITPILAGGAVSGIVIGIALQDTLSNVFAGFFLNIDRPVKIGDYIKIDNGQEGFVQEIGWRYTKVRLWANNLIVIPNNKLSQSIITNFNLPAAPVAVYVSCGVSYDSDLEHVEEVVVRVAKEVQEKIEGGDSTWLPIVRFNQFGESSINFTATLRSVGINPSYVVSHEFIKHLHRAFKQEGIDIPYPIRTVYSKTLEEPHSNATLP